MRNLGYIEGKDLAFEMRYAEGKRERYPPLAAELVRLKVDVIVVGSAPGVRAAKEATTQIPIVMWNTSDPVGEGLIASLARPGGNVTGIADLAWDLNAKRLELLKAIAPKVIRVAILQGGFGDSNSPLVRSEQEAAEALGMKLVRVPLSKPQDFDSATAAIVRENPDALLLNPNPVNYILRNELADFALKHRLPTVSGPREAALAGILITYSPSTADMLRDVAVYIDKIFKGANPAVLAVAQPSKFQLVINLKTAKALGLTIPQSLLLRADEVIQ